MPPLRFAPFLAALLLAGCASIPGDASSPPGERPKAVIHFRGATDPQVEWMRGSTKMQWGLLFTRDDLVVMKEQAQPGEPPALINSARYAEKEFLNRMATFRGIANGESRTLSIEPGTYDWLVLIDVEGDGVIDGYLGTQASQGPLAVFEFLPGKQYTIDVDAKGDLAFRIEGEPAADGEDVADPIYLALVDSMSARFPFLDDELLRDYVGLIVDEIDALRAMEGELCYALIQGDDDEGIVRAYDALPAELKIRENAIMDRVLRSARVSRPIVSETEATERLGPVMAQLERIYGADTEIIDDDDLFAENRDLGCSIHRDLLLLMLRMPLERAAPVWRHMFTLEAITNI